MLFLTPNQHCWSTKRKKLHQILFNFKIQQTHSSANFYAPTSQSNSASHLGLKISWPKITDNQPHQQLITQFLQTRCSSWRPTNTAEALKASNFTKQNTGSGPKPPDISLDGNTVESVNSLVYPGSLQSSDGQYLPDLTRRIGLDCGVMTSLKRIWSDKCLTFDTKLHIYQTPVLSVLLYAADTWCEDSACFHHKCLKQVLGIWWYDPVQNDEVLQWTGLTSLSHLLSCRRISVFGHVALLDDNTLANMALQLHINVSFNWPPDRMWRRPPVSREQVAQPAMKRFHRSDWRPL